MNTIFIEKNWKHWLMLTLHSHNNLILIDKAKDYLKGKIDSHPESGNLKKIGKIECTDENCL